MCRTNLLKILLSSAFELHMSFTHAFVYHSCSCVPVHLRYSRKTRRNKIRILLRLCTDSTASENVKQHVFEVVQGVMKGTLTNSTYECAAHVVGMGMKD